MMSARKSEILISTIAGLLSGVRHVAVGVSSPIPGAAATLARELSGGAMRVSLIGDREGPSLTDSGLDIFDCAAQGRIDAFFLGGGQIDGQANINLVGIGDYPRQNVRWAGSFGSPYLYFLVPRVILFREEHSRRVFVSKVDFISAPGTSEPGTYRPGGPHALVTGLCLFMFDRERGRFHLASVHPGHTLEEVRDQTGFDFDSNDTVPETKAPTPETLALIRGPVARRLAGPYPLFAERLAGGLSPDDR